MKLQNKQPRSTSCGFTLVELLVVIAIIATLAAIGSVAAMKVVEKGRKTETSYLATSLVSGVTNYYTDYNTLPIDNATNATLTTEPSNAASSDMLTRLTNRETGNNRLNTKNTEYFNAKIVTQRRAGIFVDNGRMGLYDAWKNAFNFSVDHDYDNRIQDPINNNQPAISARILVWSYGRNNNQAEIPDHVYSWK